MWRKGPLTRCCHLCWECKLVQPLWKTVWKFLKKLKMELPYALAVPLPGTYPNKKKHQFYKKTCTPMFTAVLFTIAKIWKQLECPSAGEWIKEVCIDVHGALLSHEKSETSICNMDRLGGSYPKWNKSDRGRQILYDITYMCLYLFIPYSSPAPPLPSSYW